MYSKMSQLYERQRGTFHTPCALLSAIFARGGYKIIRLTNLYIVVGGHSRGYRAFRALKRLQLGLQRCIGQNPRTSLSSFRLFANHYWGATHLQSRRTHELLRTHPPLSRFDMRQWSRDRSGGCTNTVIDFCDADPPSPTLGYMEVPKVGLSQAHV